MGGDEMNTDELKCKNCGATVFEASQRGAYLKRVNPIGENFVGECAPLCDSNHGNQDDALINAVEER